VNSESWGFVANCFNVRRVADTLRVSSNLGVTVELDSRSLEM
jgi:hypothetical protein